MEQNAINTRDPAINTAEEFLDDLPAACLKEGPPQLS